MRRREFIAGLSGAAVWPLVTRAQQTNRMRRLGAGTILDQRAASGGPSSDHPGAL
jgi:hypothetical protein